MPFFVRMFFIIDVFHRMAATRRLNKELGDLKKSEEPFLKCVQDLQPNAQTQFKWSATILPEKVP